MDNTCDPTTVDLETMMPHELLETAQHYGVRWHFIPLYPAQLLAWGGYDPTSRRIVEAMRYRCDELSCFLAAHRPPWPPIPQDELEYRRDVLTEPDLPTGDIPLPVLKAMVVGWIFDVFETQRAMDEWEREIAARDTAVQR